jgi:hypothetical protein
LTKKITQSIIYLIFLEKARKEIVMELTRAPVGYVKYPEPLRGISPATLISAKKPRNPLIENCQYILNGYILSGPMREINADKWFQNLHSGWNSDTGNNA